MSLKDLPTDPGEKIDEYGAVRLFSKPSIVKMLVVLMDRADDTTVGTITDQANVAKESWYSNKDLMIELGMVEKTREEGGMSFYKMADNKRTKAFRRFVYRLDGADVLADIDDE